MAQVVADFTHPDGFCSLFNDGALNMAYLPESCLRAYSELIGNEVSARNSFALDAAGYYGLRTGESLFIADCGPIGPRFLTAHSHGDVLAFEWSVDGHRIVVDAGVFEYNAGPRRDYARSTHAHNTLTLDGMDQAEFWGAFRVARRPHAWVTAHQPKPNHLLLQGLHDGYARLPGSPLHQRTFSVRPDAVEVNDEVLRGRSQIVEARLLLHPECAVQHEPGLLRIKRGWTELELTLGGGYGGATGFLVPRLRRGAASFPDRASLWQGPMQRRFPAAEALLTCHRPNTYRAPVHPATWAQSSRPALLQHGHHVVGVDRAEPETPVSYPFIHGDLLEAAVLERALEEPVDYVMYLAAARTDWGLSEEGYFRVARRYAPGNVRF